MHTFIRTTKLDFSYSFTIVQPCILSDTKAKVCHSELLGNCLISIIIIIDDFLSIVLKAFSQKKTLKTTLLHFEISNGTCL